MAGLSTQHNIYFDVSTIVCYCRSKKPGPYRVLSATSTYERRFDAVVAKTRFCFARLRCNEIAIRRCPLDARPLGSQLFQYRRAVLCANFRCSMTTAARRGRPWLLPGDAC